MLPYTHTVEIGIYLPLTCLSGGPRNWAQWSLVLAEQELRKQSEKQNEKKARQRLESAREGAEAAEKEAYKRKKKKNVSRFIVKEKQ